MSGFSGTTGGGRRQDDGDERGPRASCRWRDHRRGPRSACQSHVTSHHRGREPSRSRDEEARLHERLVDRDESALLECLDRFGPIVYSTSLTESGDSMLAEAVTERVFVHLWRRPEAFHPRQGPLVLQLVRATLGPSNP
jgi:hypothetical protein